MEVSELTLWIARLSVLALMYLFLLALIVALLADARAAGAPARVDAAPAPPPAPAPATPPRRLVLTAGTLPSTGREYPLTGSLQIGRDAACDIIITNGFVSSRHARIFSAQGQWLVEDLGSTNGTVLNDTPVTAPQPLTVGDHLLIGDTAFLLM